MPVLRGGMTAAALPVHEDGTMTIVRQHRYALDRETLEPPAAGVDDREDAAQTARRERAEDAGLQAGGLAALVLLFAEREQARARS
jgi:ADP-ribose diphosphatase